LYPTFAWFLGFFCQSSTGPTGLIQAYHRSISEFVNVESPLFIGERLAFVDAIRQGDKIIRQRLMHDLSLPNFGYHCRHEWLECGT
jgi:hypothetical protein